MALTTLTQTQLQSYVPSAFATAPWQAMSQRYRMIPTIDVINHLQAHGFLPVQARQGRTRIPGKQDFTRHVIRFSALHSTEGHQVGEYIPQIVLSNAHDGTSAYKIMLGMFRLACLNGLMVHSDTVNEISVQHSGPETLADDVLEASYEVIEQAPQVSGQIEDWRKHELDDRKRLAFAESALELHEATLLPEPPQLLRPRRYGDDGRDIWSTLNVVQENMIRGGQATRNARGQRRHVRAIKSLNEDIRLNRALWKLTEALANQA